MIMMSYSARVIIIHQVRGSCSCLGGRLFLGGVSIFRGGRLRTHELLGIWLLRRVCPQVGYNARRLPGLALKGPRRWRIDGSYSIRTRWRHGVRVVVFFDRFRRGRSVV